MQSVDLGARIITERKTADVLKRHLLDIVAEWQITADQVLAIVTDHGSNIVLLSLIHI